MKEDKPVNTYLIKGQYITSTSEEDPKQLEKCISCPMARYTDENTFYIPCKTGCIMRSDAGC